MIIISAKISSEIVELNVENINNLHIMVNHFERCKIFYKVEKTGGIGFLNPEDFGMGLCQYWVDKTKFLRHAKPLDKNIESIYSAFEERWA